MNFEGPPRAYPLFWVSKRKLKTVDILLYRVKKWKSTNFERWALWRRVLRSEILRSWDPAPAPALTQDFEIWDPEILRRRRRWRRPVLLFCYIFFNCLAFSFIFFHFLLFSFIFLVFLWFSLIFFDFLLFSFIFFHLLLFSFIYFSYSFILLNFLVFPSSPGAG